MSTALQAIGNNIILKQHGKEEVAASGLIISTSLSQEKTVGDVVSVGEGKTLDNGVVKAIPLAVGDTVIFRNAQRTNVGGTDYLFVNADDVLAKVA